MTQGPQGPVGPEGLQGPVGPTPTKEEILKIVSAPSVSEFKQLKKNHDRLVKRVEELEGKVHHTSYGSFTMTDAKVEK